MASPIHVNNEAAQAFACGDYKGSTALLQAALAGLRSRLAVPSSVPQQPASTTGTNNRAQRRVLIRGVPLLGPMQASLQKDNCNGITFFDRTFLISTGGDNSDEVASDGDCKVCALMLYNMGVSHHLEGLATGSEKTLERAFRVYELALEYLQLEFLSADGPTDEIDKVLLLVSMALMNNIAHIQSSWFNYAETDHCVKWLREAAAHLDALCLQDMDYMFFFVRYYVIPSNHISSSPAA